MGRSHKANTKAVEEGSLGHLRQKHHTTRLQGKGKRRGVLFLFLPSSSFLPGEGHKCVHVHAMHGGSREGGGGEGRRCVCLSPGNLSPGEKCLQCKMAVQMREAVAARKCLLLLAFRRCCKVEAGGEVLFSSPPGLSTPGGSREGCVWQKERESKRQGNTAGCPSLPPALPVSLPPAQPQACAPHFVSHPMREAGKEPCPCAWKGGRRGRQNRPVCLFRLSPSRQQEGSLPQHGRRCFSCVHVFL